MSDPMRAIADAVLYEGYMLWPYRRSALKNQRRWTFGGVFPPALDARRIPTTRALMRTQVLLESDPHDVDVTVRFLQVEGVERIGRAAGRSRSAALRGRASTSRSTAQRG